MVDPPASLCAAVEVCSRAGRGILEAGLLVKAGTVPRVWFRLGVPLMVPALEAMMFMRNKSGRLGGR